MVFDLKVSLAFDNSDEKIENAVEYIVNKTYSCFSEFGQGQDEIVTQLVIDCM